MTKLSNDMCKHLNKCIEKQPGPLAWTYKIRRVSALDVCVNEKKLSDENNC